MKQERAICPFCGGRSAFAVRAKDYNQRTSDEVFRYSECACCGLIFLTNAPADLASCYVSEQYFVPMSRQGFLGRALFHGYKLDLLMHFKESGRILEIGPATGEFAYMAKHFGFTPTVIEMDANCHRFMVDQLGLESVNSSDPASAVETLGSFDIVCMWQVIEHIPLYWQLISVLAQHLAANGIIMLSTPNPRSFQARVMQGYWPHLDAPRHLYLIRPDWFSRFADRLGLEVLMLTTRDTGSIRYNQDGWRLFLQAALRLPMAGIWNERIGSWISGLLAGVETREGKGACYTVVLRKRDAPSSGEGALASSSMVNR